MGNFALGYKNTATAAYGSLSGGSWETTAPLTLLLSRPVGKVTQSTDDISSVTTFTFTYTADQTVQAVGLAGHNLGANDTVRVRLYDSGLSLLYDSGQVLVWAAGTSTDDMTGISATYALLLAAAYTTCRSVRFDFDIANTGSSTPYVRAGRLFLGKAWVPDFNFAWGVEFGLEDTSTLTPSISGAEFEDVQSKKRFARFQTPEMTESEAKAQAFAIQRIVGVTGEVLFFYDQTDTTYKGQTDFLGHLRALNGIVHATVHQWSTAWDVREYL